MYRLFFPQHFTSHSSSCHCGKYVFTGVESIFEEKRSNWKILIPKIIFQLRQFMNRYKWRNEQNSEKPQNDSSYDLSKTFCCKLTSVYCTVRRLLVTNGWEVVGCQFFQSLGLIIRNFKLLLPLVSLESSSVKWWYNTCTITHESYGVPPLHS